MVSKQFAQDRCVTEITAISCSNVTLHRATGNTEGYTSVEFTTSRAESRAPNHYARVTQRKKSDRMTKKRWKRNMTLCYFFLFNIISIYFMEFIY